MTFSSCVINYTYLNGKPMTISAYVCAGVRHRGGQERAGFADPAVRLQSNELPVVTISAQGKTFIPEDWIYAAIKARDEDFS